jgi:hypothetical protein
MEHVGGGREARPVAAQDRLMQQILGDQGLASGLGEDLFGMDEQPIEVQPSQARFERLK